MQAVTRLFICIIAIGLIWGAAFGWYVWTISGYATHDTRKADAIIVLTGGGGRVEYGMELLADGRAGALFISGVNKSVPLGDLIEKAPETLRGIISTLSDDRIAIGRDARNTIGNAEESAEWVKRNGHKTILLVTADYHMPRSLIEFKQALPDVEFIPEAVVTKDFTNFEWLHDEATRNLLFAEFHKMIAAKLRHMIFFK